MQKCFEFKLKRPIKIMVHSNPVSHLYYCRIKYFWFWSSRIASEQHFWKSNNIINRGNFIIEHWPITLISLVILLYLLLLCCVKFLSYTNHYFLSGLTFKNTTTALLLSLVTFPTLKPSKWSEIWMKTRTHFQLWNPLNGSALMTQKVYIQDINPEKELTHWQFFFKLSKKIILI